MIGSNWLEQKGVGSQVLLQTVAHTTHQIEERQLPLTQVAHSPVAPAARRAESRHPIAVSSDWTVYPGYENATGLSTLSTTRSAFR